MIDYQREIENIYSHKPVKEKIYRPVSEEGIVLYGAGKMGKMAIDLMKKKKIFPKYIIDQKAKGNIEGVEIIAPHEIPEIDKQKCTFLVAIVTLPLQPIINSLCEIGCQDVRHFYDYSQFYFPDLMSNGWEMFNLTQKIKNEIESVLNQLSHDEPSVIDYLRFLWWRLKRKDISYSDFPVLSDKKYFRADHFPDLTDEEIFVDGGAHFGYIIDEFINAVNGKFKHIFAFEPDSENISAMKEHLCLCLDEGRITIFDTALTDINQSINFFAGLGYASKTDKNGDSLTKTVKLDDLIKIKPTIIKLHIEGDELKALKGAKKIIKKNRPILMVLADHNKDGLYKIAKFLYNLDKYKLYFNLHDYCGNSAIFYAYPEERIYNLRKK